MNLGYEILYGLGMSAGALGAPFSRKIREGFSGRMGLLRRIRESTKTWEPGPIWFHVASSGELEQCFPILDEIRVLSPNLKIFVSYFSPTAKRAIQLERERRKKIGLALPIDYSDYLPWDLAGCLNPFFNTLKPQRFVSIHREIWPGVLRQCRLRKIPASLVATYFPPRTKKPSELYRRTLYEFSEVLTTQESTTQMLAKYFEGVKASTVGDPRIDRVIARRKMQLPLPWVPLLEGQKIVLLASVWRRDLEEIEGAMHELMREDPTWRWVLVPHEPSEEFVKYLMREAQGAGREVRRWSQWLQAPDADSVLVVDRVGELAELYRIASFVFLGGSFTAKVHNVLEPAVYGKPILVGPHIKNSGEAVEMKELQAGLISVATGAEFLQQARQLMHHPSAIHSASEAVLNYINTRKGAARRYAEILLGKVSSE